MTEKEYLLTVLAEEAVEVAQRCTKILRFGLYEVQPGQELNNEERLRYEMTDLFAVMEMLYEEGVKLIPSDPQMNKEKKEKVRKYMKYSTDLGIVKSNMKINLFNDDFLDKSAGTFIKMNTNDQYKFVIYLLSRYGYMGNSEIEVFHSETKDIFIRWVKKEGYIAVKVFPDARKPLMQVYLDGLLNNFVFMESMLYDYLEAMYDPDYD